MIKKKNDKIFSKLLYISNVNFNSFTSKGNTSITVRKSQLSFIQKSGLIYAVFYVNALKFHHFCQAELVFRGTGVFQL